MLFTSIQFAIYLPIVFALYWVLRGRLRVQNFFVVAASYLFYGWWDWRFLLLIAFTTACSYLSGMVIGRAQRAGTDSPTARIALWSNVAINLAILGLFKYYDFFAQSFADLFMGGESEGLLLHLILPVGISFYTFQALGYSIDVYRRKITECRDVLAFAAYISFFPQLVAGPIERATSLLPQFQQPRHFQYAQGVDGLRQMLWGSFKKMVVADGCALYVDKVFANPGMYGGSTLLLAAVLFTIQIYGDFSGYSDIAVGCAKLFGIQLRSNFKTPYFSRNMGEFWRRWHISLTTWFRDYIYIPLGGSRTTKWRVVRNTFIIFLVSGLWHGANWTFVTWGLYHALLFLPLILMGRNRKHTDVVASGRAIPSLCELGQMTLTFLLATLGWILFRADSLAVAATYFRHLFCSTLFSVPYIISATEAWSVALSVVAMAVVEWLNHDQPHEFCRLPKKRLLRWTAYLMVACAIGGFCVTNEMPFIYFQF